MIISKRQLFFSLLVCGFLMSGCEVDRPDQQSNSTESATIAVSGLAYYDTALISDAQVLFVNMDDQDLFFATTTDENGRFALSLDQSGDYEISITRTTESGSYDKQYVVTIESGVSTYDVGEIEVEFYPAGSDDIELAQMEMEYNDDEFAEEEFGTIEGELITGWILKKVIQWMQKTATKRFLSWFDYCSKLKSYIESLGYWCPWVNNDPFYCPFFYQATCSLPLSD